VSGCMVAGWESFTSAGGQQRVYRRQRGSSCSFSTDTSSTPTALHGSVPLGSAAANIALALALALREPPPAGTLAVHRHAMITHPQKTSWSSLMQAEGIPDQLHQRGSSGILDRREHVSCTTTLLGSWSCSWAGTFVLPNHQTRVELWKLQRMFVLEGCVRFWRCPVQVLGWVRRRLRGQFRYRQLDQASLISGCKIPQTGRGPSRKEDRTPPTASLVDPASPELASLRSSSTCPA
jgi:hypothetical protein